MVEIISKGQTDELILVTVSIQKEPLKAPRLVDTIDVHDLLDEEIKQIIKAGL